MSDVKVVLLYRLSNYLYVKKCTLLAKVVCKIIRVLFSAEIPPTCRLGKDVQLKHGGLGIVLHDRVSIGDRTIIFQNVTIGGREGGIPSIGHDVYIGTGAVIIGDVTIGNGAKIGANAVVISDVPDNHTAVGVPAVTKRTELAPTSNIVNKLRG